MDSFPQCQVCHQQFTLKGPAPYLLPCLHAVCETCVTSTAGGVISCSTCRREVNLTQTHLQKDLVRQREIFHLTVQHRPSELLCTHEHDGNQAVCWCQECEEFLCEHCQNMHESFKATKRHVVQDIKDIRPGNMYHEEYCRTHEKNPVDLWDSHCNLLICSRCTRGDHDGHQVQDIDAAVDQVGSAMEVQERNVQSVGDRHNNLLERAREQRAFIDETSGSVSHNISHTFQSLRTLQDQREKELLIDLQQNTDEVRIHLDNITEAAEPNHLQCQETTKYINKALLYTSKYDLLTMKKTVDEKTQVCLDSTPDENTEGLFLPMFTTKGLENLKSSVSSFGNVSADMPEKVQEENTYIQTEESLAENQSTDDMCKKSEQTPRVQDLQDRISEFEVSETALKKRHDEMQVQNEQEREALESKVSCLQTRIAELEATEAVLRKENAKINRRIEEVEKMKADLDKRFQATEKSFSSLRASVVNIGIHLDFDKNKANYDKAHVNTEGHLINKFNLSLKHYSRSDRLTKFEGTSSTAPLPRCGSPQYWEMKVKVSYDQPLTNNCLLMEIGLCREEERDQHYSICGRRNSYVLYICYCETHNSICRTVCRHGSDIICLPHTFPNTPAQSADLHYGVAYDDTGKKVAFLDITENKLISTFTGVDSSQPLWPMFGVYNQHYASVSMSLVVDHDIQMWEGKKAMIQKALLE